MCKVWIKPSDFLTNNKKEISKDVLITLSKYIMNIYETQLKKICRNYCIITIF